MTQRNRRPGHARFMVLAALAMLPFLAGCQTQSERQPPEESPRQFKRNPQPQQVVRVHGRVPPSVALKFMAQYALTEEAFKDPKCEPRRYKGQIPVFFDFVHFEDVKITRNGDRYEAQLPIDLMQPSACAWEFMELVVVLAKDGKWDEKSMVSGVSPAPISPYFKGAEGECDDDKSSKSTKRQTLHGTTRTSTLPCRAVENTYATPVWVRCEMFRLDKGDPEPPRFYCGTGSYDRFKQSHLVTPQTREVQMDIYDLAVDPDPYQPKP